MWAFASRPVQISVTLPAINLNWWSGVAAGSPASPTPARVVNHEVWKGGLDWPMSRPDPKAFCLGVSIPIPKLAAEARIFLMPPSMTATDQGCIGVSAIIRLQHCR